MKQPNFKYAKLDRGSVWRIFFYCLNPETQRLERVRKTCDLNRITDIHKREAKANEFIKLINEALDNGWNYFIKEPDQNMDKLSKQMPTVISALDTALKMRLLGMADKTSQTYRSFIQTHAKWLNKYYPGLMLNNYTEAVFIDYLYHKHNEGHGNRNMNDTINFFKTTFDRIMKHYELPNPIKNYEYLPKRASTLFKPITVDELEKIVPALVEYNPYFYLFTKFIPYEFIRPYHIARLKAADIDYQNDTITLGPHTTKNKQTIKKQLLPALKKSLISMGYHELPGDYYLFGKNFYPSRDLYKSLSIRAAEVWKKVVIDGLGIDKKMYALKHTAAQFMVNKNENIDMNFLRRHMEHHSISVTEIYLQNNVEKKIDGNINLLEY